jgi:putative nucleotidyltransferase with HDIG domain
MSRLAVISGSAERFTKLKRELADCFQVDFVHVDALPEAPPGAFTLVDIDLRDPARTARVRHWLSRRPHHGKALFAIDRRSRHEEIQAYAIGATGVISRPIKGELVLWKLSDELKSVADMSARSESGFFDQITACVESLQNMFAAVVSGQAPDTRMLHVASAEIVARIEAEGLAHWLDVIRQHHSQTYQHSLLVTAVAVSFGKLLGFGKVDQERLASAGLLHDLGKARVPIEILEKPTALTEEELGVMRTHPELGFDALRNAQGLSREMLDMVLHHHEYLDGSGYPHGLRANEISDLVRIITIADIFGALIERRPYKAPMSGPAAYGYLQDMGAKLERGLVTAFHPLAHSIS